MRKIRPSGSEGGVAHPAIPTPIRGSVDLRPASGALPLSSGLTAARMVPYRRGAGKFASKFVTVSANESDFLQPHRPRRLPDRLRNFGAHARLVRAPAAA